MAEYTLSEVFGTNAEEDPGFIYIAKTDMQAVGLTVDANTSYEAYFAAMIAICQQRFTQENQNENPDQSVVIEDGLPSLVTRNNTTYRQNTKTIIFEKLDEQSTFDPDDY
jgi:hypothetical protein